MNRTSDHAAKEFLTTIDHIQKSTRDYISTHSSTNPNVPHVSYKVISANQRTQGNEGLKGISLALLEIFAITREFSIIQPAYFTSEDPIFSLCQIFHN